MRSALIVVALALPAPLLALLGGTLADRIGRDLGAAAAKLGAGLTTRVKTEPPSVLLVPLAEPPEQPARMADARKQRLHAAKAAAPAGGIHVRSEAVLRLAQSGVRPSGIPVRAEGDRPAGLALVGVSGLGIGLVDGDILTHAGGVPVRSAGAVVGMVIASRGARVPQISGRFWRAGRYYDLVVDQPYLHGFERPADVTRATISRAPVVRRQRASGG